MFSIIIPLYNKEKYIVNTIKSVLNQSFSKFEVIVVDDGSSDNGVNAVKKIDDSRIKIITQKNQGVSAARNNGIKYAKYEYIAFLDADDLWEVDYLDSILKLINYYPEAGAYGTNYKLIDIVTGEKKSKIEYKSESKYIVSNNYYKLACANLHLTASSAVVKKKVFDEIGGFPEGYNTWEDVDMWCRIGLAYKVAFLNEEKVIYNQNVSESNTNISKWFESPFFNEYETYIQNYRIKGEKLFYLKEYVARHHIQNCIVFNRNKKNIKESIRILYKFKNTKLYKKYWCKALLIAVSPKFVQKIVFSN